MEFNSLLIHGGIDGDILTGAVSVPIYQTSTYAQKEIGVHNGYEYSRTGNPTRQALEDLIRDLEYGFRGFAFASGMAAISTVLMMFKSGEHILLGNDVYGGTFRIIDKVFVNLGIEYTLIDSTNPENIESFVKENTKAIFIETPSNPLMKLTNIEKLSIIAKNNNLLLIVDNTFMTPYLQKPLEFGADIVVHSGTKYLGGHSDLVAGLAVVKTKELGDKLHFLQNATGSVLGPMDSWLLIRGIKTLSVRMDRHCENAVQIVDWMQK